MLDRMVAVRKETRPFAVNVGWPLRTELFAGLGNFAKASMSQRASPGEIGSSWVRGLSIWPEQAGEGAGESPLGCSGLVWTSETMSLVLMAFRDTC